MATLKEIERMSRIRNDNNRQLCKQCGHSMSFVPEREKQTCSWCYAVNYNQTRARFYYMMLRTNKKKQKITRIEENENGKKNK